MKGQITLAQSHKAAGDLKTTPRTSASLIRVSMATRADSEFEAENVPENGVCSRRNSQRRPIFMHSESATCFIPFGGMQPLSVNTTICISKVYPLHASSAFADTYV